MQIVELESIPRDRVALQELISQARRQAARSRAILTAAALCVCLALCVLMYGCARSQPAKPAIKGTIFIPILQIQSKGGIIQP